MVDDTADKYIFLIFNSLIQACQNCPIDLIIGLMIPDTVRYTFFT